MLLKQIFCLLPYARIRPILELQQTRQQCFAEHLGAFAGKKRGQVINADDIQWQCRIADRNVYRHGRLVKGRCDVVDGDRVVRVRSESRSAQTRLIIEQINSRIGANVAHHGKSTGRRSKRF